MACSISLSQAFISISIAEDFSTLYLLDEKRGSLTPHRLDLARLIDLHRITFESFGNLLLQIGALFHDHHADAGRAIRELTDVNTNHTGKRHEFLYMSLFYVVYITLWHAGFSSFNLLVGRVAATIQGDHSTEYTCGCRPKDKPFHVHILNDLNITNPDAICQDSKFPTIAKGLEVCVICTFEFRDCLEFRYSDFEFFPVSLFGNIFNSFRLRGPNNKKSPLHPGLP